MSVDKNQVENMKEMKEHLINQVKKEKKQLLVKEIRYLTDTSYVISVEKDDIEFIPGQYMTLGLIDNKEMREYSIYSGIHNPRLEFLIKEVEEGDVSKQLKKD